MNTKHALRVRSASAASGRHQMPRRRSGLRAPPRRRGPAGAARRGGGERAADRDAAGERAIHSQGLRPRTRRTPTTRESARPRASAPRARAPRRSARCTRRRPSAITATTSAVRRRAGVLDEVRVLGREARAADRQAVAAGLGEQQPAVRPSRRGSSGFLKVEPNVLIPCGWASWRRARISASVAFTACWVGGLQQQARRARRPPRRPGSSCGSRSPAPPAQRRSDPCGRRDLDPLEHPLQLAAVGVRVHPHRAADGAGDVHAELDPRQAPPAPRARRPRAGARRRRRRSVAPRRRSPPARGRASRTRPPTPSSAISRFEPDPTTLTGAAGAVAQASSSSSSASLPARAKNSAAPPVRTVVSRASGKSRCTAAGGAAHAHGAPTHGCAPHERPSSDVAGAHHQAHIARRRAALRSTGSASANVGSQYTGLPAAASAAASAISSPLTPGRSSARSRAG